MSKRTKAQAQEKAIAESRAELLEIVKPGDTVFLILRHVSKSGMQREISAFVMVDGEPRYLNYHAAIILGTRVGKHDGVVVGGCGMDMGFSLVYNLSCALFPGMGRKPGDPDYSPHGGNDPGYLLKHRWM